MKKRLWKFLIPAALVVLLFSGCGSATTVKTADPVSLDEIPSYTGDPYTEVNGDIPFFSEDDYTTDAFEKYSDLDSLGRCGVAYANVCQDLMPTEERGDISDIYPSGWENNPYDFVDGGYLYNRCHLIAHELTGEDANEENLITGTRYFNVEGMLPFENMVADYVKETDDHVLYRVTPMYEGNDLLASGVLMEARSVEDGGSGICYCVFCYNVEPGVDIDYTTGDNREDDAASADSTSEPAGTDSSSSPSAEDQATAGSSDETATDPSSDETGDYILNTSSMKFHLPTCPGASDISEQNKEEYSGSRSELISEGYEPCKSCNP